MKNFTYHQPTTIAATLPLLDAQWGKTELLVGGTDLLDRQKEYVSQPDKVVSLTGIGGAFKEIRAAAGAVPEVVIGAGVKLVDLAESSLGTAAGTSATNTFTVCSRAGASVTRRRGRTSSTRSSRRAIRA